MLTQKFFVLIAATLTLSALATASSAQVRTRVKPGACIRFSAPTLAEGRFEATIVDMRDDDIVVHAQRLGSHSVTVTRRAICDLEISRGRKTQTRRYMANGFLIGAATGVVVGLADGDDPPGFVSFSAGDKAMLGAIGLGLVGMLVGAAVGSYVETEAWEPVSIESLTVGMLGDRTPGVVVALDF